MVRGDSCSGFRGRKRLLAIGYLTQNREVRVVRDFREVSEFSEFSEFMSYP